MYFGFDPEVHKVSEVGFGLSERLVEKERFAVILFPAIDVLEQEPVSIVEWQEDISDCSLYSFFVEIHAFGTDERTVDEIETDCVGAELFDDVEGIRVVLFALRHFLAVFGEHDSVND